MAMVARYWEELNELGDELLVDALASAWREHPTFFPSLGEVRELVTKAAKKKRDTRPLLAESTTPGGVSPELRRAVDAVKSIR